MRREAEAEAEGWGWAVGLHLEVAMHDVDPVQVLHRDRHLRREGAAARGCAGRRGAAQCVHARAMRCVRCAACAPGHAHGRGRLVCAPCGVRVAGRACAKMARA